MADVNTEGGGGGGKHHQKKRAKKLPTRIDMTPLVDLGFLLLTFFMLTTTFSKPKIIELVPPVKTNDSTKIKDTLALTVILSGNNKVYYYNGTLKMSADSNNINLTDLSDNGIRKVIIGRNNFVRDQLKPLDDQHDKKQVSDTAYARLKEKVEENKFALFVVIKTDSLAKYVNVVSLLDDMELCNVGKYAIIDANQSEVLMMRSYNNKHNIK
jgi:biopolymer transport protein ExbD